MEGTKIHFSPTEIELVNNVDIILTKNEVLRKIKSLLSDVMQLQFDFVQKNGLGEHFLFLTPPKISKGENYLGLPYMVLDYPRISNTEDFFFIRIFFWWGHFFSTTLHIKGESKKLIYENLQDQQIHQLKTHNYYISVNPDPWIHHFDQSNYQLINSFSPIQWRNSWNANEYIKLASKWPLKNSQFNTKELFESWNFLLHLSGLIS